ncbi:uncharacterized protein STEHIDRAFT_64991 [Stereum hirsutum FP-91666 SS1]|uniref:uncharacterized protein n=1 Tax=Stereum hirsutum (strain FP-91666) TaxID=721885 RepID=UPI0004449982|nr:uncharacterized protein STEHIDRAFT_64991 [Stereum hirsutum FP-91666 SS1]EIM82298.1 hypothetical protein STEHIDRAFT_64991 [Stereum hirsutum FP-91666 SS1]
METQISIPETLGCIELGVILSAMIYGVMCVQSYNYHQHGFKDKLYIHLLVRASLILSTTHMVFIIISLYTTTVNRFGNPEAILEATWSISFSVFLAMLVNCPVQSFLAYKIRNMSHSWALTIFSWVGSLFRLTTGLALSILAIRVGRIDLFEKKYQWLMVCNLVMGASVDIWNAGWLCFYLYWERPKFSA